jgi:Tfp pilus assembly protein PilV
MRLIANQKRTGLSLLEVIVSTAIFFLSIIAIYGLLDMGQRNGENARQRGQALRIAEARIAETAAGVVALESASGDESACPGYQWEISCEPFGETAGLVKVTARSFHRSEPKRSLVAISQVVLDPNLQGSLMDGVPPPSEDTATEEGSMADSTASSSSSGTGTSGASGASGASGGAASGAASSSGTGSASKTTSPSSGGASTKNAGSSSTTKTGGSK